jgi:hypothetical protein
LLEPFHTLAAIGCCAAPVLQGSLGLGFQSKLTVLPPNRVHSCGSLSTETFSQPPLPLRRRRIVVVRVSARSAALSPLFSKLVKTGTHIALLNAMNCLSSLVELAKPSHACVGDNIMLGLDRVSCIACESAAFQVTGPIDAVACLGIAAFASKSGWTTARSWSRGLEHFVQSPGARSP